MHAEYAEILFNPVERMIVVRPCSIYKDFAALQTSVQEGDEEGSTLDIESLEVFENIAYIMAKHADPENVPDNPDEWLEAFNTFSIYEVLPQLIELWGLNVETQAESKKTSKN